MNIDRARHLGIGRPFRLGAAGGKRQQQGQTQKDTVHDGAGQAFTSARMIRMPIERPMPQDTKRMKAAKVFSFSLTGMLPCLCSVVWSCPAIVFSVRVDMTAIKRILAGVSRGFGRGGGKRVRAALSEVSHSGQRRRLLILQGNLTRVQEDLTCVDGR